MLKGGKPKFLHRVACSEFAYWVHGSSSLFRSLNRTTPRIIAEVKYCPVDYCSTDTVGSETCTLRSYSQQYIVCHSTREQHNGDDNNVIINNFGICIDQQSVVDNDLQRRTQSDSPSRRTIDSLPVYIWQAFASTQCVVAMVQHVSLMWQYCAMLHCSTKSTVVHCLRSRHTEILTFSSSHSFGKSNAAYGSWIVLGILVGEAFTGGVSNLVWNSVNNGKTYETVDWSKFVVEDDDDDEDEDEEEDEEEDDDE